MVFKNNNKTRLLILIKNIDGGTGTYALTLKKLGKGTKIVCLEKPSYRKISLRDSERIIYLRNKDFYPGTYNFTLRNIYYFCKDLLLIKRKINQLNPSIILSIDIHCNFLVLINKILFFNKLKIITTTHINLEDTLKSKAEKHLNYFLKILIRLLYNHSDAHAVPSFSLGSAFDKTFKMNKNSKVIYHGIFSNRLNKAKISNKPVVITVARLVEQKDHRTLILAFSQLIKRVPNAQLWIASKGHLEDQLKGTVTKLGLGSNIHFLGWIELDKILPNAKLFVLSSKREGFGYVIIEAMSYGLPVISTNTPFGPSEILDGGKYGILVPMKNPKKLADAIYSILNYPDNFRKYNLLSLKRIKDFSEKRMLTEYTKLIERTNNEGID